MLRVETGADHVCRVTLERPEAKNALTVEMRDQLVEAVRAARADADVRALLITGTGDAFCAGMDLKEYFRETEAQGQDLPSRPLSLAGYAARARSA